MVVSICILTIVSSHEGNICEFLFIKALHLFRVRRYYQKFAFQGLELLLNPLTREPVYGILPSGSRAIVHFL